MKKHVILAAVAALATFTACSNEDEEEMIEGAPVNFTITAPSTRAITNNAGTTTFENGDKIYIYSSGLYTDMAGEEFHVSDLTLVCADNSKNFKYNGKKGATFIAYYFNNTKGTVNNDNTLKFTVNSDQTASGSFDQNDLMTSRVSVTEAQDNAVNFAFNHRFTLVKVDVSGFTTNSLTIQSIKINNVKLEANWNTNDNRILLSGNESSVQMGKFNSTDNEYWAIVPAQTVSSSNLIEVRTSNNKVFTYTGNSSFSFEEGKMVKFTLTPSGFNNVSASITTSAQWGSSADQNVTMDERIIELISTSKGTFTSEIVSNLNAITTLTISTAIEDQWYVYYNNNKSTSNYFSYEWNAVNGAISMTASKKEFFNHHIGYRLNAANIKKSINKKFKIHIECGYPDEQADAQITMNIMRINKHTNSKYCFFKTLDRNNSTTKWSRTINMKSVGTSVDYYVDLTKIHRNQGIDDGTYSEETATDEDYNDVVLILTPNSTCSATHDGSNWTITTDNKVFINSVSVIEVTD